MRDLTPFEKRVVSTLATTYRWATAGDLSNEIIAEHGPDLLEEALREMERRSYVNREVREGRAFYLITPLGASCAAGLGSGR